MDCVLLFGLRPPPPPLRFCYYYYYHLNPTSNFIPTALMNMMYMTEDLPFPLHN